MDTQFALWFDANIDRLSDLWNEHLSYMQDSREHVTYLMNNDMAFGEFAENIYEMETKKASEVL